MADRNNPGQFGNREDTEEQARKGGEESSGSFGEQNAADPREAGREGGQASSGSFGEENSADPAEAGRRGAEAQPTEAKREGGLHSHDGDR
ncbi:stress protein [Brachybacterium hainanense]|uniref:Stress protein n=1 Tax=Brachybacterium hainanense TaxID=1541174 RepID=A0ABV6RBI1_9MICO